MTPSADLVGLADRIHAYAGPQRNARLMNVPADMLHKWATELRALAGAEVGELVAEITGIDEYGPMLSWHKHWVDAGIGTKLYAKGKP